MPQEFALNCIPLLSVILDRPLLEENETSNESDLLRQNEDSDTTDEEEDEDEDETMLDDPPMPVVDMKSYVTGPFEEIKDDLT